MGANAHREVPAIVGRDDDLRRIADVLAGDEASAGTVVVVGETGIGKTVVAREAARRVPDATLIEVACLPLAAVSVPFLPLRAMMRSARGAKPPVDLDAPPAEVLLAFDAWISEAAAVRRVVLTVDDAQWADPATLDLLFYLIAGPADRAVSLIITVRDEPGPTRPVDRWLANVRRTPHTAVVPIGRLDRAETAEQLESLLGAVPHQTLVDDVWRHTQGHPFFTALVVAGVDPGARSAPAALPDDLLAVVRESIQGLGEDAVHILRVIAVAGRPLTVAFLRRVLDADDTDAVAEGPEPVLAAALERGILMRESDGAVWFRHPLMAESLRGDLSERERERWHARLLDAHGPIDPRAASFEEIGWLADQAAGSGNVPDAYRWSVVAAERAFESGSPRESLRLYERALVLRPHVEGAASEVELLDRARRSASEAAAMEREIGLNTRRLALTDPDDVLVRSELVARSLILRLAAHQEPAFGPADVPDLLRLTTDHQDAWQHAYALAVAAICVNDPEESLEMARRSRVFAERTGSDRAIAWAFAAVLDRSRDPAETAPLEVASIELALRVRDGLAHNIAAQAVAAQEGPCTAAHADALRRYRARAARALPRRYAAWLAVMEAGTWLRIGRWTECAEALRFTIGEYPGRAVDVAARMIAGRLAVRRGDLAQADGHFARLTELCAERATTPEVDEVLGRVELALDHDDPLAAVELLEDVGVALSDLERMELAPAAARTLADVHRTLPAADVSDVESRIGALGRRRARRRRLAWQTDIRPDVEESLNALRMAEITRADGAGDAPQRWMEAAESCAAVEWPWEEAYACFRAAESLLIDGGADRVAARPWIARGMEVAGRIGAARLESDLQSLARFARIPLVGSTQPDAQSRVRTSTRLPGLTPRESEIVALIVEGRTYREIAAELFLSEKTVSSHMSNILRKTGSANRIDLARRAEATIPSSA